MSRSVKTTFPLFFAIALSLMVMRAPLARAHETDQFTPPAGREFADIGDELTKTAYTAIDKGVNKINAKIKGEIDAGRSAQENLAMRCRRYAPIRAVEQSNPESPL